MISNDRREKERLDARNALEEYVYEIRGKIQEGGNLYEYVDDQNRESISRELDDTENWLYEDGETCEREVYKTKLTDLHQKTDPIKLRCDEYTGQAQAFNDLGHACSMARKAVEQYRSGDPKYDHLTETEMLNISEQTDKTQKWFEEARGKLSVVRKTQDPPVKVSEVRHEWQTLTACVNSVINRPKPRPPTPPKDEKQNESNEGQQPQNEQQQQAQQEPNAKPTEVEMDVE
jgi:heat shock protein 110kDa